MTTMTNKWKPAIALLALSLSGQVPVRDGDGADAEVKQFRFDELEARLRTMQPGPERDYFAGVLANRSGRLAESIGLLKNALPVFRASRPDRAAVALEALADDYTKNFRYADAAEAYDDLLTHFASEVSGPARLQDTKDNSAILHILDEAPAQTIAWDGPVHLKTGRNTLGLLDTDLTVNGVHEQWLLDTGANLSVVSRSFARRLGLVPLPGAAQTTSGMTGIENPLSVALVPVLQMGGAKVQNVVVMILDDANLNIQLSRTARYQINGIIGYPVFRALGKVGFLHNGGFEAGDGLRGNTAGARMYMNLLNPVIECGVEGVMLPFSFDTGAASTDLSVRYYEQFRGESGKWKKSTGMHGGAGGAVKHAVYIQPQLRLRIGDRSVTLNGVSVLPSAMGAGIDELYGNIGQDVVAKFDSFTIDFANMTFSLGTPLP